MFSSGSGLFKGFKSDLASADALGSRFLCKGATDFLQGMSKCALSHTFKKDIGKKTLKFFVFGSKTLSQKKRRSTDRSKYFIL